MTTTPTIWKAHFTANSGTGNLGTQGTQFAPQSIGLANGNFLVVWDDDARGPSSGRDILGQIFDPLGNPVGAEFQVNSVQTLDDQTHPKIAAMPDGGYVLVYASHNSSGVNFLAVERYNSAGAAISADLISNAVIVDSSSNYKDGRYGDYEVTVNAEGDYIVAFEIVTPNDDRDVHTLVYNHATNARSSEQVNTVQNGTDPDQLRGISTFANGDIIAVSYEPDSGSFARSWYSAEFRITSATGVNVVSHTEVGGRDNHSAEADDVAVLSDGTFVVLYHYVVNRTDEDDPVYYAMRIGSRDSSNNVTLGSEIKLSQNFDSGDTHREAQSSVVALPDGGFFVAWVDFANSNNIVGTRYSSNGTVIGTAGFLISNDALVDSDRGTTLPLGHFSLNVLGDLSLTSDGRILVAYTNGAGDISEVILDPRDTFIDGTDANEVLTTQTTATFLYGEGGNDTLYGRGGGDFLDGGPGNDTIFGGAGADQLTGGAGADMLRGETGDDTYILDTTHLVNNGNFFSSAYDTVIENANEGIDGVRVSSVGGGIFGTVTGYTLTANVENGLIAGTAAFNLTGNALANILTGNSAANTLSGLGDNDLLTGGGGDDRFVFAPGGGADKITDFVAGTSTEDRIDLTAFHGLHTINNVLALSSQVGANTVINFGNGDTLTLQNVAETSLNANDFILAPFQFQEPTFELASFGSSAAAGGWSSQNYYPREMADVNGDGRADIVGFGSAGTYVALGSGNGFAPVVLGINGFGAAAAAGGWSNNDAYHRTLADVNGDGRADIVGFGGDGTFVSLATTNGQFANPILGINSFGASAVGGGWSSDDLYHREVADVNGDGKADIVGFGSAGVYVSLATSNGQFAAPTLTLNSFGSSDAAGGWSSDNIFHREMADVNGDGKADIVGFGGAGVYVGLATSNGNFAAPTALALNSFGYSAAGGSWTSQDQFPRHLADINADGRADIVGFGGDSTFIAYGNANGTFTAPTADLASFSNNPSAGGWASDDLYPRMLADIDGGGAADIIGFGSAGVYVSHSNVDWLV